MEHVTVYGAPEEAREARSSTEKGREDLFHRRSQVQVLKQQQAPAHWNNNAKHAHLRC